MEQQKPRPKPPNAGKGRPKGSKNKMPATLKRAAMAAAKEVGDQLNPGEGVKGYLKHLAVTEPTSFASILRAILPTEVKAEVDATVTTEEAGAKDEFMALLSQVLERGGTHEAPRTPQ